MEISLNELKQEANVLLKKLSDVYLINKAFFVQAEEILTGLKSFLAPVLEHRDAFDHLMRGFSNVDIEGLSSEKDVEIYKHRIKNIDKALGHELRAFFDVADYICISIRTEISVSMKKMKPKQIQAVWKDYLEQKSSIIDISQRISDVRKNRGESFDSVYEYKDILENVFDMYKKYKKFIEPELKKNYK